MQYVNFDIVNNTDKDMECRHSFPFNYNFLKGSTNDFNLKIGRADYCLNNMPIFYLDRDIEFKIDNPSDKSKSKDCILPKGFYSSIMQLINVINNYISFDVGQFTYNTSLNKIQYKVKEYPSNFKLIFPTFLKKLFDGFNYISNLDNTFHEIVEKSTNYMAQEYSTTDRFSNMKSIKVYANIGQQPHIEASNVSGPVDTFLLSDQVITATDSLNRLIYIPTQYRTINLTSYNALQSIELYVQIEYANLKRFPLTLAPGNYFNTLLIFEKK